MNTDIPTNTTDASTVGTGGDFVYAGYDTRSGTGSGARDDRFDESQSKPGVGDKLRGTRSLRSSRFDNRGANLHVFLL